MTTEIIEQFKKIVGSAYVFLDTETLDFYGHDFTEKLQYNPDVVIKPATAEEISAILKICNEEKILVTPRAGGTGVTGGALATQKGVLLSIERLNKIINIDERNLQVITETGVITEVLQEAVKEKGLFYPPDPSSKGTCFIAGNIAENSGGPKAVKYGVVKDYVLNLEVVLPTGEIIWTGANVLKNASGYNLTQLMIGSEGTLGIVTKAVLKLIPLPQHDLLMLAPFNSLEQAAKAVSAIFRAGFIPSALEFVEINALQIVSSMQEKYIVPVTEEMEAHLIVEVDGNDLDVLMNEMQQIAEVLMQYECGEIFFADDASQKEELWKLRRRTAEAVKAVGYTIEEDTVVPRAELPKLIKGAKELAAKYDFKVVCYGHAGDGNIHVRIFKEGHPNSYKDEKVKMILEELFRLVKNLNGLISAEHGIGIIQKEFMPIFFDDVTLNLMRGIKKLFDPNNILNTGKIIDIEQT